MEFKDDFIFIPTGFKSNLRDYGWTEFNFEYNTMITIEKTFFYKTMPMLVIENLNWNNPKAIIHPTTEIFIKNIYTNPNDIPEIEYTSSKVLAYSLFKKHNYRLSIVSEPVFINDKSKNSFKVIRKVTPSMVWCLYRIHGDSTINKLNI